MSKLEDMLASAAQKYYENGSSEMTDAEFDQKLQLLKSRDPHSSVVTSVGYGYDETKDSTKGLRCNHRYGKILGLEKVHNYKELGKEFKDNTKYEHVQLSLKLDGISIVLYYQEGKMVQGLTRGGSDGLTGIDVTDKVKAIGNFDFVNSKFIGAIRGEVLMTYDNFEIYKKHMENTHPEMPVSNPRNVTAGLFNRDEIDPKLFSLLDIVVYSVVGQEGSKSDDTVYSLFTWLEDTFPGNVVPNTITPISMLSEVNLDSCMSTAHSYFTSCKFPTYPEDGIVITLGCNLNTETHERSYISQAYKFPSECKDTMVRSIEWNMSKNRYAIPTVIVDKIELDGTNVQRCTGYNAQYIQDNEIEPGVVVEIEKKGKIIPNINKVVKRLRVHDASDIFTPTDCPECGTPLTWRGVNLYCPNPSCKNASTQDLLAWMNNVAPMDYFGDALRMSYLTGMFSEEENITVETLMDYINSDQMQYELDAFYEAHSVQSVMFADMLTRLATRHVTYADAIKALNIPRFGEVNSRKLAQYPKLVDELIKYADNVGDAPHRLWKDLWDKSGAGLGEVNTMTLQVNISKFKRLRYLEGRIYDNNDSTVEMKGKIAITGKLSVKRSDFEKELKSVGYEPSSSVSKDTTFLITDDPNSSSDKNKKADKYGVTKLTESEFRMKYMNN